MQIQRTNTTTQSAAATLLAALAKSDTSGTVSFQRQFAETIDAVSARRQTSGRQEQAVDSDSQNSRTKVERRKTERETDTDRTDTTSQADSTQAAAPVETRQSEPASDNAEPAADDTSAVSTEAVASGDKPQAASTSGQGAAQSSSQTQTAEQAEEPSMSEAARTLLAALGEAARTAIADGAVDDVMSGDTMAALAALGVKLQTASTTTPTDTGETAEETTPEFAVKDALSGLAAKTSPDESTALTAKRATVRQEAQAAQVNQSKAEATSASDDQGQFLSGTGSQVVKAARDAAEAAQTIPQVQADVVTINVTGPTTVSVDGSEDAALGRITAPTTAAKAMAATEGTPSSESTSANQTEQIDRIARVMRASIGRGGSRVNLELEPRDLGALRIQMNLRGNELTARFETQTESARQYLEQSMNQLREGLAQGGIRLVQATVENHGPQDEGLGEQSGGRQMHQDSQQGGDSSGRQETDRQAAGEAATSRWAETSAGRDTLDIVA